MKKPISRQGKQFGKVLLALVLSLLLCITAVVPTMSASAMKLVDAADKMGADAGKYISEYASNTEVRAATKAKNVEVVQESAILLKNGGGADGSEDKLPYSNISKVSLFGVASWKYGYGGTGSGSGTVERINDQISGSLIGDIYHSFENKGIEINNTLLDMYKAHYPSGSPSQTARYANPSYNDNEAPLSKYTEAVQASYANYNDAALIFINRLGGEGADLSTSANANMGHSKSGEHYLQLTDNERAMIAHVQENFQKVVVLYNAGNVLEMGDLMNDPKIDAIINIGQTGDYGFDGVIDVIRGAANPSGRTVDIIPTDFLMDPTTKNFGNIRTSGTSMSWVEYEEGIYLGYKYYETIYQEIKDGNIDLTDAAAQAVIGSSDIGTTFTDADDWYKKAVTFPFGYGLSYTTFEWSEFDVVTTGTGKDMKFTASVKVTNNGTSAGKDVVQLYMSAPYTKNGIEKAAVQLVGYVKTSKLAPGASEVVTVSFDAYDIAAYDYSDANNNGNAGYEIEAGNYVFSARTNSHDVKLSKTIALTEVLVKESQVTGNVIENQFVKGKEGARHNYSTISPTMTILSRGDMIATFPKSMTTDERAYSTSNNTTNPLAAGKDYIISKAEIATKNGFGFRFGTNNEVDEKWNIWAADAQVIPDSWTQAADTNGTVLVRLPDMMGIDPFDNVTKVVSANAAINGKTGTEAWDIFMNQLTYTEMLQLNATGFFKTLGIARIGKPETVDPDGPCTIGGQTKDGYTGSRGISGTRYWASESNLAQTWNLVLAKQVGRLIGEEALWCGYNGWYAPSMNTHRSPFSGRNFEYYSQDGVQAGLMAAAVISAVSSRGVFSYIKHFALNDQEQNRGGIYTWADEQTIREIYLRPFQYAVQGGNSCGIMTGFNRIGSEACTDNYALLTGILRNEWGFCGIVVTDYQVGTVGNANNNLEIMHRVGNNIPLGDRGTNALGASRWDASLRGGKGGVTVSWASSATFSEADKQRSCDIQYYYTRKCALETLYTTARSNAMDNGYDFAKNFTSRTVTAEAGKTTSIGFGFPAGTKVTYKVQGNPSLPAGVTFNAADASFTVAATAQSGASGTIKLNASIDGWATNVVYFGRDSQSAITVTVRVAGEGGDTPVDPPVGGDVTIPSDAIIVEAEVAELSPDSSVSNYPRIEQKANNSGGAIVGYMSTDGNKMTLRVYAPKAVTGANLYLNTGACKNFQSGGIATGMSLADFNAAFSFKMNGTAFSFTGTDLPDGTGNYEATFINLLGKVNLKAGENVLEIEAVAGGGANFDYFAFDKSTGVSLEPIAANAVVTFNANGGTLAGNATLEVAPGSKIANAPTAVKDGFTFDGWFTAAEGGDKIDFATYTVSGDVTLYAQYKQNAVTPGGDDKPEKPERRGCQSEIDLAGFGIVSALMTLVGVAVVLKKKEN